MNVERALKDTFCVGLSLRPFPVDRKAPAAVKCGAPPHFVIMLDEWEVS